MIHSFFNKDVKKIQWGKWSFQQMVLRSLGIHEEKNEVGPLPHTISGWCKIVTAV